MQQNDGTSKTCIFPNYQVQSYIKKVTEKFDDKGNLVERVTEYSDSYVNPWSTTWYNHGPYCTTGLAVDKSKLSSVPYTLTTTGAASTASCTSHKGKDGSND